jgi:hypothetical protein
MAFADKTAKPKESNAVLLTPAALAERLAVPVSWIREKTRQRARERDADPLPVVPLGKYTRFDWDDIVAWIERQKKR